MSFNELSKNTIYILSFIIIIIAFLKAFSNKLTTPYDYMKRSNYMVSFFRSHTLAIKILEEALSKFSNLTDEERSFINFQIGVNYHHKRKYNEAVKYFEKAWPYLKSSKIPFNKMYACIVVSYYNIGEKEKAREIYHFLRKKELYDINFIKLSYLENSIFK